MSMFPGYGAQIYYNDAGEPIGWDYPSSDDYDHDDWYDEERDRYQDDEDE